MAKIVMDGVPEEIQIQLDEYGNSLRFRKHQWLEYLQWFCGGKKEFIREFAAPGVGGRFIVESVDQLRRQIAFVNYYAYEKKGKITSPFISVNDYGEKAILFKCQNCKKKVYQVEGNCPKCQKPMRSRTAPVYKTVNWNTTLLDFDVHPPKKVDEDVLAHREWVLSGGALKAFEEAVETSEVLYEKGIKNSLTVTGGKGCQIWSDYLPDARKMSFLKKLTTLDTSTINDHAQVARPPYTLHPKTLLFCLPFSRKADYDRLLSRTAECPAMPLRYNFNGV